MSDLQITTYKQQTMHNTLFVLLSKIICVTFTKTSFVFVEETVPSMDCRQNSSDKTLTKNSRQMIFYTLFTMFCHFAGVLSLFANSV